MLQVKVDQALQCGKASSRGRKVHLLDNVELNGSSLTGCDVFDAVKLILVKAVCVSNVSQPVLKGSLVIDLCKGGFHTSAIVVSAHDDVLHLQIVNGILNHRHDVEVGVDNHVGNVSVDKESAWWLTNDLVGWHTGVTASDPEDLRGVASLDLLEKCRLLKDHSLSPSVVSCEECVEVLVIPRTGSVEEVLRVVCLGLHFLHDKWLEVFREVDGISFCLSICCGQSHSSSHCGSRQRESNIFADKCEAHD